MSEFIESIKLLYEEKKNLENPPKYVKILKELLELEGVKLNDHINEGD